MRFQMQMNWTGLQLNRLWVYSVSVVLCGVYCIVQRFNRLGGEQTDVLNRDREAPKELAVECVGRGTVFPSRDAHKKLVGLAASCSPLSGKLKLL